MKPCGNVVCNRPSAKQCAFHIGHQELERIWCKCRPNVKEQSSHQPWPRHVYAISDRSRPESAGPAKELCFGPWVGARLPMQVTTSLPPACILNPGKASAADEVAAKIHPPAYPPRRWLFPLFVLVLLSCNMGVSENQGPQYGPQTVWLLLLGHPQKKDSQFIETAI